MTKEEKIKQVRLEIELWKTKVDMDYFVILGLLKKLNLLLSEKIHDSDE